jgi:hypothetical protein
MFYNGTGINEGGMVNGAMSRKVEITLNSAVSLVQTLRPLLFIPCYKIVAALNRMFGRCTTGSVTELKQRCDSVRLLFLITAGGMVSKATHYRLL